MDGQNMTCQKCNHEMKEYLGLFETGWYCANESCGDDKFDIALDGKGNQITPTNKELSGDFADAFRYVLRGHLDPPKSATEEDLDEKTSLGEFSELDPTASRWGVN